MSTLMKTIKIRTIVKLSKCTFSSLECRNKNRLYKVKRILYILRCSWYHFDVTTVDKLQCRQKHYS